jgi:Flp pilus assembly protein TadG
MDRHERSGASGDTSSATPRRSRGARGQALVEFALVVPIVLVLIIGIAEFGWFMANSSALVSASREAARYASSVGDDGGTPRYIDCAGIRGAARDATSAVFTLTDDQIRVTYDDGAGGTSTSACAPLGTGPVAAEIDRFDRVVVEVRVSYSAMTPLGQVFLGARELVSVDRRSIGKAS